MSEESKAAARKLLRGIAAVIIKEMASSDISLEEISVRICRPYTEVLENLVKMINGISFESSLDFVSDVTLAMGAELDWEIVSK